VPGDFFRVSASRLISSATCARLACFIKVTSNIDLDIADKYPKSSVEEICMTPMDAPGVFCFLSCWSIV